MGSVTISSEFIAHVHEIFWQAIDSSKYGHVSREGINIFTGSAPPAYICCVAAVEAFVNELFFGLPTFKRLEEGPMGSVDRKWLERIGLKNKLILFPQLLVGETFDRGSQPYKDMTTLIRLRNAMVHYKMENKPPSYLKDLEAQRTVLVTDTEGADYLWMHKLSCTEGIRWANNTSARTVHKLVEIVREGAAVPSFLNLANNFQQIAEDQVKARLQALDEIGGSEAP